MTEDAENTEETNKSITNYAAALAIVFGVLKSLCEDVVENFPKILAWIKALISLVRAKIAGEDVSDEKLEALRTKAARDTGAEEAPPKMANVFGELKAEVDALEAAVPKDE